MKIIRLTIKFQPKWILENQNAGKSKVVEDVIETIKKHYEVDGVFVVKKEFHQCSVVVACENSIVEEEIGNYIKQEVATVSEDTEIGIQVEEIDVEEFKCIIDSIKGSLQKEHISFIKDKLGIDIINSVEENEEDDDLSLEEIDLDNLELEIDDKNEEDIELFSEKKDSNNLIAMEPLLKWVNEVDLIAKNFKEVVLKNNAISNFVFIMSINRGNGLSTAIEIMVATLERNRLFKFEGRNPYIEYTLEYNDNPDEFPSFEELHKLILKNEMSRQYRGIVVLNVEEWIDHLNDKRFERVLDFMWRNKNHMLFVMTLPYVEDDVIDKLRTRVDDIISVRTMKFIPPSDKQYYEYFEKYFKKFDIRLCDDVFDSFALKITGEKNDGRFYGFNTVKKIADEVLYKVLVKATQEEKAMKKVISAKDLVNIYGIEKIEQTTGIEKLNDMVALNDVKSKVQEIISTVKLQKEMYSSGKSFIKPCFHMMFTGNPGTGKTVVARIIGRIFKEEGLLSVGNFFEVSRKDFIGKFVGHTAPKTMEICRNALGSVLFIDEAYLLADDHDGFSAEAVGTLIAEMENNRDKMVVIFAGYENKLEHLFDINPGLRDRIPYKINFPNYDRDELKSIFYLQLNNKISYDSTFEEKTNDFFEKLPDEVMQSKDFSNGRFVRNLAERIISKAALRFEMSDTGLSEFCLTNSDFEMAVADSDLKKLFNKVKKSNTIGF